MAKPKGFDPTAATDAAKEAIETANKNKAELAAKVEAADKKVKEAVAARTKAIATQDAKVAAAEKAKAGIEAKVADEDAVIKSNEDYLEAFAEMARKRAERERVVDEASKEAPARATF